MIFPELHIDENKSELWLCTTATDLDGQEFTEPLYVIEVSKDDFESLWIFMDMIMHIYSSGYEDGYIDKGAEDVDADPEDFSIM